MIEAEKLTKYYGTHPALVDVDFQIEKGEIVGFLGPNGAGKSTTLRLLTGYFPPSRGTVRLAGFDIRTHPLEVRKRIGYLPENVPLYKEMTVRSFLFFMAALRGLNGKRKAARVEEVLKDFMLHHQAETLIHKLSKGYRQLTGMAQAFVHEPEVLILDEPTLSIDPRQVVRVRERIKAYGRSHTVVLSSHILPEVALICDRILVMDQGRIVAADRPERLAAALGGPSVYEMEVTGEEEAVRAAIEKVPEVLKIRCTGEGTERRFVVEGRPGKDLREALSSAVTAAGFTLLGLTAKEMSLEDIFLRLTRHKEDKS